MVKYRRPLDTVFKALSDPTRREIVQLLTTNPMTVTEIASRFSVSLPAISKHLKVLERAFLIDRRKDGRTHWIALNTGPLKQVEDWVGQYRAFWEQTLDRLDTYLQTPSKEE